MNIELSFPEIQYYMEFIHSSEKDIFREVKSLFIDNSLDSQLSILERIIKSNKSPSNEILFAFGKILYYLSDFERLEQEIQKHSESLHLLLWSGLAAFRKGDFYKASNIFKKLKQGSDVFLQIEGIIGLARISDRQGQKKETFEFLQLIEEKLKDNLQCERKDLFIDSQLRKEFVELWTFRTERNVEESKKKALEILKKASKYGDRVHIARLNMILGIFEKYLGNWEKATDLFNIALTIFQDLNNKRGEAAVLSNIADVEQMEGKLDSAQERLLDVKPFYEKLDDKRSLALVYSNLGEIKAQKKQYDDAIKNFLTAKRILNEIDARDEQVDFALTELYIEQKKWNEFNSLMNELFVGKSEEEISQNPHIMYLYGRKEMGSLNLQKAKKYFSHALKIAEDKSMDHLGIKILLDTLQVSLFDYISKAEESSLSENRRLIEDLKIYVEENMQNQILRDLIREIEELSRKTSKTDEKANRRKLVLEMQRVIREIVNVIRYSSSESGEIDTIHPNQLIVLHRSGIPLKRYVKSEKIVDDILLFGGMVRAAKDIISEVFMGEIGKVMKIDYGEEIIILAEFGEKETGIVMITRKDTFHQRRSLHESVKELNKIEIPQKYHGNISKETEQLIDEIISNHFGTGYTGEK